MNVICFHYSINQPIKQRIQRKWQKNYKGSLACASGRLNIVLNTTTENRIQQKKKQQQRNNVAIKINELNKLKRKGRGKEKGGEN